MTIEMEKMSNPDSKRVLKLKAELEEFRAQTGDSYDAYGPSDFLRTQDNYERLIANQRARDELNRALGRNVDDPAPL